MAVWYTVTGLVLVLLLVTPAKNTYISPHGGRDITCYTREAPCKTIKHGIDQIVNSSCVIVNESQVEIIDGIDISGVSDITIIGNGVTFHCSEKESFIFHKVQNIKLCNFTLAGCGSENAAALFFKQSTNISMHMVKIEQSFGIGMTMSDVDGKVFIHDCDFSQNGNDHNRYPGGLLVSFEFSKCALLDINNVKFWNNTAKGKGLGGGMAIFFAKNSHNNTVTVTDCIFSGNKAVWGGGLFVLFRGTTDNNLVQIRRGHFQNNSILRSGGGIGLGYRSDNDSNPHLSNTIQVNDSDFKNNHATYGGGTAIFSMHFKNEPKKDVIQFYNCTWHSNTAYFSPAVDVSPYTIDTLAKGFLPSPLFNNCIFESNIINLHSYKSSKSYYVNRGAFVITSFKVKFAGTNSFTKHQSSALHITSGSVEFENSSNVHFVSNTASSGGAIAMYGFSFIHVHSDSHIQFINNSALDNGGAIFVHSFDQHDFTSTRSCFIKASKHSTNKAHLSFTGNTAKAGCSIYSLTFFPCIYSQYPPRKNIEEVLNAIAKFKFDESDTCSQLATSGQQFISMSNKTPFEVIPGKKFKLPLKLIDELKNETQEVWRIAIDEANTTPPLVADRAYTAMNQLTVYGHPGSSGNITIHQQGFREVAIRIEIKLLQCPPGYYFDHGNSNQNASCLCSSNSGYRYRGIKRCSDHDSTEHYFRAYLDKGYWAGYSSIDNSEHSDVYTPEDLLTSPCPLEFCNYDNKASSGETLLPNTSSVSALENLICGSQRKGVLCGKCQENLTVYFHSPGYKCGDVKYCKFSAFFYIISEVFPMALLFITIVLFDIQFTSGTVYGFVFFCQAINTLSINGRGVLELPKLVRKLSTVYQTVYGTFSLDFFNHDDFSFCLWKGALVQSVLSFKFVTTVIAFFMILALVLIMHYCWCSILSRIKKKISTRESVIHGLSAFLIMSYAQCAKVSFQILSAEYLTGPGVNGSKEHRVTFYGGVHYHGSEHIPHAALAYLFLILVVIIPPVLILFYHPYLLLLEYLGLSSNQALNLPIIKLKPFLDSFHSCFKPRFYFFAGVYLLYRIALLLPHALAKNLLDFNAVIEVIFITILGIHAIVQPYKNWSHNIIDALIFIDLALINGITLYISVHQSQLEKAVIIKVMYWIQMILIYLPLLAVCAFLVYHLANHLHPKLPENRSQEAHSQEVLEDETAFHESLDESTHGDLPYQEFELSD